MLVKHVNELIGNTPLFEIPPQVHGLKNINLFAKLELLNPFGSVKTKVLGTFSKTTSNKSPVRVKL